MQGLAQQTAAIFDKIATLDCIRPYVLVGGTALSLQLGTRVSEDLDFQQWKLHKSDKLEVDWVAIEKELKTVGQITNRDIWDFNHVEFLLSGVKISFYIFPDRKPEKMTSINIQGNLQVADIRSIGAMKMEVLLRRNTFRDYYDIYSILKSGVNLRETVEIALKYSGHLLSTKNLLAILSDCSHFSADKEFAKLQPIYDVTPKEIETFIKREISSNF
ncbi:MAG: nucleotidyl transferase AbiEii/AbiGii toxin family protein [Dysgonamonadaceae bacterium]|jgi:predicted nucleotidyltransferase component of viral defense system|nr:nucleotidyl transferase AbiEii/AbiGii toxin family protein [Dysgonamonadaceae bacterium]